MQQSRNFDYYHQLNNTVTYALLHLYSQIALTPRFTPKLQRNAMLIKFLKPKLKMKSCALIKSELRLMLNIGRNKQQDLEKALIDINQKAQVLHTKGTEKLYSLLNYLTGEGFPSELFFEGDVAQPGVVYLLEEHITAGFDESGNQVAPISLLVQHENALSIPEVVTRHGCFASEMKEWSSTQHNAHILLHPL